MKTKILVISSILFLILLSFNAFADSPDWDLTYASACGYGYTQAEMGTTCFGEIKVKGLNNVNDLKAEMYIEGYEYGEIKYISEPFDVDSGTVYRKKFWLKLPQDMKEGEYTIYGRVYDKQNTEVKTEKVSIIKPRHSIDIQDVIFKKGTIVNAGDSLAFVARIENLGAKTENNIQVTAEIPELQVSTYTYADRLVSNEENIKNYETSGNTEELYLKIPESAESGEYNLKVRVDYDKDHKTIENNYKITVKGKESEKTTSFTIKDLNTAKQNIIKEAKKSFISDLFSPLKLLFGALVIILIIIGLVIALRKT